MWTHLGRGGNSSDGTDYIVRITQDGNGFRMFGDPDSRKLKILIIGDSDTHATEVSDDKTYYAVLRRLLDAEIFAYGVWGYGSLQEWMILDRYYDLIKPDLILWQLSIDDLNDNSPGLKTADSNALPRPYWIGGHIRYVLPKEEALLRYCRICYMVAAQLARFGIGIAEAEAATGQLARWEYLRSVETTGKIMEMVMQRAQPSPVIAFVTGTPDSLDGPVHQEVLAQLCRRHHILFLDGVEDGVAAAQANGADVKAYRDYHWNELGHRIVGETLANALKPIWQTVTDG
jgi:hypothetical protein